MEAMNKKKFSRRKFVSIGLFLTFAVLVITAIVIQIFEALKDDFFMHFFTVSHIFTGLAFTILSVLHIKLNWQSMKSYVKFKQLIGNREAFYALLLTMLAILLGFLFVYFIMD